jgi:regulatory protein
MTRVVRPHGRGPEPPVDCDDVPVDPEQVARTIALRRLEAAPRTRVELARTLAERGVPDDVAERVLDRFDEVGLVDDRLFAHMWVQSRQAGRGLSGRALRAELRRKGVAEELINDALATLPAESEEATARRLAVRRMAAFRGLPAATASRRLAGFLARKGYSPGLVAAVVREVVPQPGAQQADAGGDPQDIPFA